MERFTLLSKLMNTSRNSQDNQELTKHEVHTTTAELASSRSTQHIKFENKTGNGKEEEKKKKKKKTERKSRSNDP